MWAPQLVETSELWVWLPIVGSVIMDKELANLLSSRGIHSKINNCMPSVLQRTNSGFAALDKEGTAEPFR